MRQREDQIEIFGVFPLWINDNGECRCIQNTYNGERNFILVTHSNGTQQEYNIAPTYTIIPEIGLILYKTQEDAIRFQTLISNGSYDEKFCFLSRPVLENQEVGAELDFRAEPGLYVLDELDFHATYVTEMSLRELRYLDKPQDINHSNTKMLRSAEGKLRNLLLTMCKAQFPIDSEDEWAVDYRLVFEVSNVGNKSKLTSFPIKANPIFGFVRFSDLNGYPIFINKENAVMFRQYVRLGQNPWDIVTQVVDTKQYADDVADRKEKIKLTIINTLQFAITHWSTIYKGFNWIRGKIGGGGSEEPEE